MYSGSCFYVCFFSFFFFNDTSTTEIYTLSLHDALPILMRVVRHMIAVHPNRNVHAGARSSMSEEHTSELQSRVELVCRLLLEKKKNIKAKCTQLAFTYAHEIRRAI